MTDQVKQVGNPDPLRRTSPIIDGGDEEVPVGIDAETGLCYFNDVPYPPGEYVKSGSELLRCEEGGVWVRRGEIRPE